MNVGGKVSKESRDNARLDRDRAKNPPDVEPGMDDSIWSSFEEGSSGGDDPFNWGGSSNNSSGGLGGGSDPFGSGGGFGSSDPFGGGGFGNSPFGGSPFGGGGLTEQQKKDVELEDKVFSALGRFFKGTGSFLSEFVRSFKDFNYMSQMSMGKVALITGGIIGGVGLLLTLLGYGTTLGFPMLVGGLMSAGVGVPLFMIGYGTFVDNGGAEATHTFNNGGASDTQQNDIFGGGGLFDNPSDEAAPSWGDSPFGGDFESSFNESPDANLEDDPFTFDDDDEEDDDPFRLSFEDDDDETFEFNPEYNKTSDASPEAVLTGLEDMKGMYTRQFLFDKINEYLPSVTPTFDKVRYVDEDSDEFDDWDAIVQSAASVFKPKGNEIELPYLISLKEKVFYYHLEINRVNWIKNVDAYVKEIENIVCYDTEKEKMNDRIYGVSNTVGDKIYVKIMKGTTSMVSIKDVFSKIASEIKSTSNFMPIILGIDAEGNIVWRDFKNIDSILVTGMPRSGKTWTVQSILTQMMFFLSPSELHIYVLDPKDGISDYKSMKMPHIRKFVSSDEAILNELRNIVRIEGPRRKKILGDAGFVNIQDFKKKNPDIDLPYLYVVVDEVVTLAERMDQKVKDEFQGLLLELVSQLPALGIRIFMIPHLVKDQVLKKSITDLIPCRASIRGNAEHIEKAVGVRNFKHKLVHQGDMAMHLIGDSEPHFIHSAVLTPTNEGNQELFEFLTKFWKKLDPESYEGSLDWQQTTGKKISEQLGYAPSGTSAPKRKPVDITQTSSNGVSTISGGSTKRLSNSDVQDLLGGVTDADDGDGLLDIFNT